MPLNESQLRELGKIWKSLNVFYEDVTKNTDNDGREITHIAHMTQICNHITKKHHAKGIKIEG